jgi:uncharacterized protein YndB with AHSA1/START domain
MRNIYYKNLKSNQMETKTQTRQDEKQRSALQNEILINRVFDLPVSKVWAAWTESEQFKKWWGPEGFTCPSSTLEARKGGKYLNCMRSADGKEFWSIGVVEELIPEKKLVVTDNFSDAKGNIIPASEYGIPGNWPEKLLITVDFVKLGENKTKFTLRHQGIPEEMRDDCIKGWNESLDKLARNIK